MAGSDCIVTFGCFRRPAKGLNAMVLPSRELKDWVLNGTYLKHIFGYGRGEIWVNKYTRSYRLFFGALLLRLLCRGRCQVVEDEGNIHAITPWFLFRLCYTWLRDFLKKGPLLRGIKIEISRLEESIEIREKPKLDLGQAPWYLRTDLIFALKAGGSIGHIAGVVNNLKHFVGSPIFYSCEKTPTVLEEVEWRKLESPEEFWDFQDLPLINASKEFYLHIETQNKDLNPAFIYQRYSSYNFTGVQLAQRFNKPFVLEFNGSEVWIAKNWGQGLKYEDLAVQIEQLNLSFADVVVVVSAPIRDRLVELNVDPEKIMVNPNGVDPLRYSPDIDGNEISCALKLTNKIVIGFIGTFGPWHGAEVLAEAVGMLRSEKTIDFERLHLLLIGDGVKMPEVKENLKKYKIEDSCTLTGIVPQEEGPKYLAACDILASPHVPNPDGTPFFGSPTKLFEYMAMGKGIIASDLDQVGEVLEHDRTAWMVKPGDPKALAEGLTVLIADAARRTRLGHAARDEVVQKYTWREHTRRIIEKLKERCG